MLPMNPRTARNDRSIWQPLGTEDTFRYRLIELSRKCKQVPRSPVIGQIPSESVKDVSLLLFKTTIAKSFAYIAAASEGVESVSTACVENVRSTKSIVIRVAANEGVRNEVKQRLQSVVTQLALFANKGIEPGQIRMNVLTKVLTLNESRIYARLKSIKWDKPGYQRSKDNGERPLWREISQICNHIEPSDNRSVRSELTERLHKLVNRMKLLDNSATNADDGIIELQQVVQDCYDFCSVAKNHRLKNQTSTDELHQLVENKYFRRLEKIAGYFESTDSMVSAARKYPAKFRDAKVEVVPNYASVCSEISLKGRVTKCHIHAEIQLVFHYELHAKTTEPLPRVIGTSKAACFLCAEFIKYHGVYMIDAAHFRIYDQWTIPDLGQYNDEQLARFRNIISQMYEAMHHLMQDDFTWRPYPPTSWWDLTGKTPFSGPPSSKTVSLLSVVSNRRIVQKVEQVDSFVHSKVTKPTSHIHSSPKQLPNHGETITSAISGVDIGSEVRLAFRDKTLAVELFGDIEAGLRMKLIAKEGSITDGKPKQQVLNLEDLDVGTEIHFEQEWDENCDALEVVTLALKHGGGSSMHWKIVLVKGTSAVRIN